MEIVYASTNNSFLGLNTLSVPTKDNNDPPPVHLHTGTCSFSHLQNCLLLSHHNSKKFDVAVVANAKLVLKKY